MKATLQEVYKGENINLCSWGYCVGWQHFSSIASAKKHIDSSVTPAQTEEKT